ncbi:PREDICTED: PRUPE_1G557000 [Prunus dulcis]|uniref:PREDICTED: PRUPE_1G557000 n=1 Tax=Prunus dulcis TaxID=3755 RepID=A0A5E4EVI5_PRUDU|nr:PREDICTED: PRUPE_1G557000 [Prunus dulcis]
MRETLKAKTNGQGEQEHPQLHRLPKRHEKRRLDHIMLSDVGYLGQAGYCTRKSSSASCLAIMAIKHRRRATNHSMCNKVQGSVPEQKLRGKGKVWDGEEGRE